MDEEVENSLRLAIYHKLKKVNSLMNDSKIGTEYSSTIKSPPQRNDKKSFKCDTTTKNRSPLIKVQEKIHISDNNNGLPIRQLLKIVDLERQEKLQTAINERIERFKDFNKKQDVKSKQSWLEAQKMFIMNMEQQEMNILAANQTDDDDVVAESSGMAQLTQDAIDRMKMRQELLESVRNKMAQDEALQKLQKIKINHQKFLIEFQELHAILNSCSNLKELGNMDLSLLQSIAVFNNAEFEKLINQNLLEITDQNVQLTEEMISNIIDFKLKCLKTIENVNAQIEVAKAQEEENKKVQQEEIAKKEEINQLKKLEYEKNNNLALINSQKTTEIINSTFNKYVNLIDLENYENLMKFRQEYRKNFELLENDPALKEFRFDCTKAVNIPVNSLCGSSGNILDTYTKLYRLLSGQSVIISGKDVNTSRHPQGIAFSMDLLAKKFVLQGEIIGLKNEIVTFYYASVILTLWNGFADFGPLLLSYFYEICPYLIPCYIPKSVGESDEEFYKQLGYRYINGQVEKQDKFLERMTGIMRLYFGLTISKPKNDQQFSPFNLVNSWRWFASFLKLPPQLDISAAAAHIFLDTVGFEMDSKYGLIFQKLLKIIIMKYLPKCREVNPSGGAASRLESLLMEYAKNRQFSPPNGYNMVTSNW